MGRILALLALAACLLAAASSEASAWVGFATGIGPGGWGRNYSIIDDQALDAPAMRTQQPLAGLHNPVVSPRWVTAADRSQLRTPGRGPGFSFRTLPESRFLADAVCARALQFANQPTCATRS
jgi:hypothetical protein